MHARTAHPSPTEITPPPPPPRLCDAVTGIIEPAGGAIPVVVYGGYVSRDSCKFSACAATPHWQLLMRQQMLCTEENHTRAKEPHQRPGTIPDNRDRGTIRNSKRGTQLPVASCHKLKSALLALALPGAGRLLSLTGILPSLQLCNNVHHKLQQLPGPCIPAAALC